MIEKIVLAGGCFWCTEAIFKPLRGVQSVLPGYCGGTTEKPTYKEVCSGTTGHAESVLIVYDSTVISTSLIVELFFASHDPTTLNRQGNDVGTHYRSAVFYTNEEQHKIVSEYIEKLTKDKVFNSPIVTTIQPLHQFYEAEISHVDYYNLNKEQPYCQFVIAPKLSKIKEKYKSYIE